MTFFSIKGAHPDAMLVLDAENVSNLPRNFRMTLPTSNATVNWKGFDVLRAIGSGQFSAGNLFKIRKFLNHEPLLIIDLRQESHGFVNGNAISWYGIHNAENSSRTVSEIEKVQQDLLFALKQKHSEIIHKILKKSEDEVILYSRPITFDIKSVQSEAELLAQLKIPYFRIYAQDFHAPTADDIQRFLDIIGHIPKTHWVYFHCRAGVGRSTTYLVMYDIYHNAKHVSFESILQRQKLIGGKDLASLPSKDSYKYSFAVERLKTLKLFYLYIKSHEINHLPRWRSWLSAQNK